MASKLLTVVGLAKNGSDYAIKRSKTLTLVMALKSTCLKITTILVKWSVLLSFKMAVPCVHTTRNTAGHFYWRSGTVSLCQRAQMWYGYFRNSRVWKEMSHASLSFEAIQHYQFISSTCLVLVETRLLRRIQHAHSWRSYL